MVNTEKKKVLYKIEQAKLEQIDRKVKSYITKLLIDFEDIKIKVRIKTKTSALEKIDSKGYQRAEELTDVIGVMIVSKNKNQVYKIKRQLMLSLANYNIKDYIQNPKKGYQSIHITYQIKSNNSDDIPVEIQIKTKSMKIAQDLLHDKIYKNKVIPEFLKEPIYKVTFNTINALESAKEYIIEKVKGNSKTKQYVLKEEIR